MRVKEREKAPPKNTGSNQVRPARPEHSVHVYMCAQAST